MAEIHHTTLKPTKLELLTEWLPGRPWYRGGPEAPLLAKAGGFRLDDPEGEVGIEFMVVNDAEASYLVPMAYRGAPLQGADEALIGTTEHGVLGKRWVYDGCHDPVLVAELASLIDGRAKAQAQSVSDQEDRDIQVSYEGAPLGAAAIESVADSADATEVRLTSGAALRLARVLAPGEGGQVSGVWQRADESAARAAFVIVQREA
ncbi:1,4-alpha-glucan branching protein [Streptomyces sp. TRM66268-LWL]|uniref:1,4-alpha-glucan branching protein n=1 Tax=Streptomyces polyasparticus TaxID=2767826 RepID=A0ABR7SDW3_9ACTN|nr:1,4-alpha-glucan branching protein [Streptomyces polyasparticus]MBC9712661.1 1,4-alpha-glucan branching protein [Streptomyces polyasparticus]